MLKLILSLVFVLCYSYSGITQDNDCNGIVRKSLKIIRQGKDTIVALSRIANQIENPQLKKRLKKKSNLIFNKAYAPALKSSDKRLNQLSENFEQLENSYLAYLALKKQIKRLQLRIKLNESVQNSPFATLDEKPVLVEFLAQSNTKYLPAKKKAAKYLFNEASKSLKNTGVDRKKIARNAYRSLSICLNLEPGYPGADSLRNSARKKGVVTVLVPLATSNNNAYNMIVSKNLNAQLAIKKNSANSLMFIEMVTSGNSIPDIEIQINVQNTSFQQKYLKPKTYYESKVVKNERGNEITISCNLLEKTKTKSCQILCKLLITDKTKSGYFPKTETQINGFYTWEDSWVEFVSGNKRAIPKNLKSSMHKEYPYPSSEEMIQVAVRDLMSSNINNLFTKLRTISEN